MKFMMISDSRDALTGMRLAGVEGVFAETEEQVRAETEKCVHNEDIGIILITHRLAEMCGGFLDELRLGMSRPLIVTVPGSENDEGGEDIMRCVHEAIGIKI